MNIKDCEQAKNGDCCYCENMAYTKLKEENDGLKSEKDFLLQKIETLKTENEALNNCDKTLIYKQARNNFEKLKKIKEYCIEQNLMSDICNTNKILRIIEEG